MNDCAASCPNPNILNEWFSVAVKLRRFDQPKAGGPATYYDVPFYLTNNSNEAARAMREVALVDSGDYWYHGTDHKNAVDIVKNGIILGKGKPKLDFSHRNGFYLNPRYVEAVNWAKMLFKCGAVIIFKNQTNRFKGLDLRSRPENWAEVVKWNRSGHLQAECLEGVLEREHTECDYILGEMAGQGSCGTTYREQSGWEPERNSQQQVCLKKVGMAKEIGKLTNIIGVVCFK